MISPDSSDIAAHRPRFSPAHAEALVSDHYALEGRLLPLPSERDLNYLLETPDGSRFVVKFAQALEQRAVLEAQLEAMAHLSRCGLRVQQSVPSKDSASLLRAVDGNGREHFLRVLTYLPGVPLADVHPHSDELIADYGRYLGRLSEALADFDHPGTRRDLVWNLSQAESTVAERLSFLDSSSERALVDRWMRLHDDTAGALSRLRKGSVYNDANDYNVLVNGPEHLPRKIVGVIDFGDLVHSVTIADLAVAAAYLMLGKADPLRAASHLVRAYHAAFPVLEEEVSVLLPLIGARLCVSVCLSASQRRLEPENNYLVVSRQPALRLLRQLSDVHPRFAEYVFRRDCGFEPCPHSRRVSAWLNANADEVSPVVDADLAKNATMTFDFSVSSADWSFEDLTHPGKAAEEIARRMEADRVHFGIGRYGEVRMVYRGDQFRSPSESRTVHLGIDLFQPAGSAVRAAADAVIHSLADNDRPYDYGPTVILEHRPAGGPIFHTLYGHLSRKSLERLRPGTTLKRGEAFAEIGAINENGGWAPHLHFQLICDLLDREGDFPGVAEPWLRDVWMSLSPDPNLMLRLLPSEAQQKQASGQTLASERRRWIGPSLRLSYRRPIRVSRGYMQHLYDADGRPYLDTVNNVAHVGHGHPHVVEAVSRQMRVLNTNTRYLYDELTLLALRLTTTLPDPLEVCYFVNSGSEANDLALRLARAHTSRRHVAVVDHAYHGNLSSLIEISPYKFNAAGGGGKPAHTHVIPMPDPIRGVQGPTPEDVIRGASETLAAFIVEPAMSCGGQIFFPDGFLSSAFSAARDVGALCVADEVQTGFGRMGSCFWAFELQGVAPDIVTMGKPMGNGHPLGAVVTTREIARSFDDEPEYFNTFGGNPVSCAAGLAVLDTIEEEGLQQHAREVGAHFIDRLRDLQHKHPVVGDVRGSGLFIGIEVVRDRERNTPAGDETGYVVERLRERGILSSRDGPYRNVLKIKPPMVFTEADGDAYAGELDGILKEDFVVARLGRSR